MVRLPTHEKQSSLVAEVSQASTVVSVNAKHSTLVAEVSQASKYIEVVASIEQGHTVYSFVTKEELHKIIAGSVEQFIVISSIIIRQSNIRLIQPIRLTESTAVPIGTTIAFDSVVVETFGFNKPIRKVAKIK